MIQVAQKGNGFLVRWIESVEEVFLLLHNPICRVLQRLQESQAVRIIDRSTQNFTGQDWGGGILLRMGMCILRVLVGIVISKGMWSLR